MVVFYSLLNIAGINTMVIHKCNSPNTIRRREFLRNLALQLVNNHLHQRTEFSWPQVLTLQIKEIIDYESPTQQAPTTDTVPKRRRCSYCDQKKNRPTKYSSTICEKYMCLEHCTFICRECLNCSE